MNGSIAVAELLKHEESQDYKAVKREEEDAPQVYHGALKKEEEEDPSAMRQQQRNGNSVNGNHNGNEDESGDGGGVGPPPERIQAYAKLEFPFFNFYIQKLSVTIGRRPPPSPSDVKPLASSVKHEYPVSASGDGRPSEKDPASSVVPVTGVFASKDDLKIEGLEVAPGPGEEDVQLSPRLVQAQPQTQSQDSLPPPDSNIPSGNKVNVDVDLGPIKAVSRDHARLFFDNATASNGLSYGWSLEVRGRNGLVVDGSWRAKGEIVRLHNRWAKHCFTSG